MKRSLLTPRRLLAIIVGLLIVSSFLGTRSARAIASWPANVVDAVTNPLSAPLVSLSSALRAPPAASLPSDDMTREQLEQEWQRAVRQIRHLEQELRRAHEQIALLRQSREQLGLAGVRLIDARVTAYSGEAVRPVLTIDRGTTSGVRERLAVAYGFNLVGEVVRAGPVSADVRLITAPDTRLAVRLVPPQAEVAPRQFETMLQRADDAPLFVARPRLNAPVAVGDLAHLADERLPPEAQGFVVGRVIEAVPDPEDPYNLKRIVVAPIPPLTYLSRVTVLAPTD